MFLAGSHTAKRDIMGVEDVPSVADYVEIIEK